MSNCCNLACVQRLATVNAFANSRARNKFKQTIFLIRNVIKN